MKIDERLQKLEETYHKTGMLDMDAFHAINEALTGERNELNPCSELLFRRPKDIRHA